MSHKTRKYGLPFHPLSIVIIYLQSLVLFLASTDQSRMEIHQMLQMFWQTMAHIMPRHLWNIPVKTKHSTWS